MIESFLSGNNCIISNKIIKPTPVLPTPVLPNYITFADPVVKQICVENWGSDGEITYEQAAAVTDLENAFGSGPEQKKIISFDELQYFTGLTSIGNRYFMEQDLLTSITLPESVEILNDNIFLNCSSLININLENVKYFGSYLFGDSPKITEINLTNAIAFDNACFNGMQELISITIGDKITEPIGGGTFTSCPKLTNIVIGDINATIEGGAFSNENLKNVTIGLGGTGNIIINSGAFVQSLNIENITLGNSVKSINAGAFDTPKMTDIIIPDSVTYLGFNILPNAINVTLGTGLTTLSNWAFPMCENLIYNCINCHGQNENQPFNSDTLTNITFGPNVEVLMPYFLQSCTKVKQIILPESLTTLGEACFRSSGLTEITLTNSILDLPNYCFQGCSDLIQVNMSDSINSIGDWAFAGCIGLTSIEIPNSVTSIGNEAFGGTPYYINKPDGLVYINNVLYKYKGTMPANTSINVLSGTISISGRAFYGCSDLTSITIPNSVTSIGNDAFQYCSGLTSITIPNSVTSIGDWTFYDCSGLTSITIPNSVTSIGEGAFYSSSLIDIEINAEIPPVLVSNFLFAGNIEHIFVPVGSVDAYKTAPYWSDYADKIISENNFMIFDDQIVKSICVTYWGSDGEITYAQAAAVTDLNGNIFNGNTEITSFEEFQYFTGLTVLDGNNTGYSPFYGCTNLTSITLPNSVTSIGNSAFSNCTNLSNLILSNSLITIEDSAFYGCSKLTSIIIPSSVTSIGNWAFYNTGLTTLLLNGDNLTLKQNAFGNCLNLTTINISANELISEGFIFQNCNLLNEVTISGNDISIGSHDYMGCTNLTTVNLPTTINNIGDNAFYQCANLANITTFNITGNAGIGIFYECTSLTSVTIPYNTPSSTFYGCTGLTSIIIENSVTSIDESTFQNCTGLTSIVIPDSVTSIGDYAFDGCIGLTSVILNRITPPTIMSNTFANTTTNIYVPNASVDAYKAAARWSAYADIITAIIKPA